MHRKEDTQYLNFNIFTQISIILIMRRILCRLFREKVNLYVNGTDCDDTLSVTDYYYTYGYKGKRN